MTSLLQTFITEEVIYAAIKAVIDPELGINIVDLGLIYSVDIEEDGRITPQTNDDWFTRIEIEKDE